MIFSWIDGLPKRCYNTHMITNSLDWQGVSTDLRYRMHTAPAQARFDLAKMLGNIEHLVQELGGEEVEMRRCKKTTSVKQQNLLLKINKSITEYEQWLVFAQLSFG